MKEVARIITLNISLDGLAYQRLVRDWGLNIWRDTPYFLVDFS